MWSFSYPHNVAARGQPDPGCLDKFCGFNWHRLSSTPFYAKQLPACFSFAILLVSQEKTQNTGAVLPLHIQWCGTLFHRKDPGKEPPKMDLFGFQPPGRTDIHIAGHDRNFFLLDFSFKAKKATDSLG